MYRLQRNQSRYMGRTWDYKVLSYPRSGRTHLGIILDRYLKYTLDLEDGDQKIYMTHSTEDYANQGDIPGTFLIRHPVFTLMSHWEYRCKRTHQRHPWKDRERGVKIFLDGAWPQWKHTYLDILDNPHIQYGSVLDSPLRTITELFSRWSIPLNSLRLTTLVSHGPQLNHPCLRFLRTC